MPNIVDIVNFNSDASCLPSDVWLDQLKGGTNSYLYKWLYLYVENQKKVTLGFVGSSIAEIVHFNPESIDLINNNSDLFEIIIRPWIHDIGVYRNEKSFRFNIELGIEVIKNTFNNIANFYLPPEFIINNRQIHFLKDYNIDALFINPNRYDKEISDRIPKDPYQLKLVGGDTFNCISINGKLTANFLKSGQLYNIIYWNNIPESEDTQFIWRDGESNFLIPEGIDRESFILSNESSSIKRYFLSDLNIKYRESDTIESPLFATYPIHSFKPWTNNMKMDWYINEISTIENNFESLDYLKKCLFINLTNSDILAAVEKNSPIIDLVSNKEFKKHIIHRSERGFEGEQLLNYFYGGSLELNSGIGKKIQARLNFLKNNEI